MQARKEGASPSREGLPAGRRPALLALAGLASAFLLSSTPSSAAPASLERFPVEIEGKILTLPYCSNHPIDSRNESIRRVVISLHGVATNPGDYHRNMMRAAGRVPGALEETLILAPKLMTRAFADENEIAPTDVFWNTSSRRFWGGQSGSSEKHPRDVTVSSFEIFDRLLTRLADPSLFPNLRIIVLAGHSGGGQFFNRYALASRFEDEIARPRGIHVRYIVAQPSHHAYLSNERVDPQSRARTLFRIPDEDAIASCPRYNHYGYGLEGLENWPYLASVGPEQMIRQYRGRDVVYLHGMNDSDPDGAHLARGCAAMLQGAHRLERGITYFNHLHHVYGEGGHNHRISFVARVGHDHAGMWRSDEGLLHIFDHADTIQRP